MIEINSVLTVAGEGSVLFDGDVRVVAIEVARFV